MTDWQEQLQRALHRGDPSEMKAALGRVPSDVLHMAVPYFARIVDDHLRDENYADAVTYLDQLVEIEPDQARWRIDRARANTKLDKLPAVLVDAQRLVALDPDNVLGYRLLAEAHDGLRDRKQALAAYRRVRELAPDDARAGERIEFLEDLQRKDEVLQRVLNPEEPASPKEAPAQPEIEFDPKLISAPEIPSDTSSAMVAGLKQHLARYGAHQSSRNTLERLEDAAWLEGWDAALAQTKGGRVLMHGSELGTFAVRALAHGAAHVTIVETSPIDARIATGIVQKHLIAAWREQHGAALEGMTEEDRRASFEAFARNVDVMSADAAELDAGSYDWLVFPNLDQTLLGTGVVGALRAYRERGATRMRVLPGRARVFAVGIEWRYPDVDLDLHALSALRWAPYPQPLDLPDGCWKALTETCEVAAIDLDDFSASVSSHELRVVARGRLDAILYWFQAEIAGTSLDSGPTGGLRCLRPAVQFTDRLALEIGEALALKVHAEPSRLYVETVPPPQQSRGGVLPSWYVPMIVDAARNRAYREALEERLAGREDSTVLDIGAGCGLLSMMAARIGAKRVVACEVDRALARVAERVVGDNGGADAIRVVAKDSRRVSVPEDLPARADLAVFELFDCSLIGEGVLHFLADARERLLTSDAVYVPMSGRVRAMLVEYRLDRIWDVDVNILNPYRFSPEFINVDASRLRYRPLSEPFDVFAFDFATASPEPQELQIDSVATDAGVAGAVMFWFDLELAPGRWISNEPGSAPAFHWKQALQFLPEVEVGGGMALPLTARHNGSALSFRWRQDAVPTDAFSKLPRFDPRVFQQATELQSQTATLFQHCRADPEEYKRVAELAQRFAVDPAAHGLDPRIAQRFVAKFFVR